MNIKKIEWRKIRLILFILVMGNTSYSQLVFTFDANLIDQVNVIINEDTFRIEDSGDSINVQSLITDSITFLISLNKKYAKGYYLRYNILLDDISRIRLCPFQFIIYYPTRKMVQLSIRYSGVEEGMVYYFGKRKKYDNLAKPLLVK